MVLLLIMKFCRTLWSEDLAYVGISADLVRKGLAALGFRHVSLRKVEQQRGFAVSS